MQGENLEVYNRQNFEKDVKNAKNSTVKKTKKGIVATCYFLRALLLKICVNVSGSAKPISILLAKIPEKLKSKNIIIHTEKKPN